MSDVYRAVRDLNETINAFESNVDVHVNNIHRSSTEIDSATKSIYDQIVKFRQDMEYGEQNQLAHENIIRIDQILKEQFGSYETIRRTMIGVVRDFDINLVRNATIQELSEELWMTNSRYWLAYALMAVTAWVNNYPELAKNALAEGERRDAVKTTLFFCLLNLRFERIETAKHWFYEYLKTLDPTMLQNEAAVMLQAFLDGVFGKDWEIEQMVIDVTDQWVSLINNSTEICDELITAYEQYLKNMNPHKTFDYEFIKQYCTNSSEVSNSYLEVSKYDSVIELLKQINVDAVEQTNENYKERVDAVLINLMSNFDQEELELRNEQEFFNLIVRNKGVVDIAKKQYEDEMALQNDHFNIGKQMITWAIYDETANPRVKKFSFQNTKEWFRTALDRFAIRLQQEFPVEYRLSIDTWEGTTNGNDAEEITKNMYSYYETNKFQNMYVNTINIAVVIAFVLSIALTFVTPYALVVSALAVVIMAYRCLKAIKEYPMRVQNALNALQSTLAEIAEFRQYFEENSSKKDVILSETEFI